MADLHELQLRLAELHRLRSEYIGRPGRSAMARYVETLIARLEAEVAACARPVHAEPVHADPIHADARPPVIPKP